MAGNFAGKNVRSGVNGLNPKKLANNRKMKFFCVVWNSRIEIDVQVISETRSKTTKIEYSEYMHEQSKNLAIFHQRNGFYSRRYL